MGDSGKGKNEFHSVRDLDVHVTLEDQQKINSFAKCHAKYNDLQAELTVKQSELKNLEDACEELILLEDDGLRIPFLHGEIFICFNLNETQTNLQAEKNKVAHEITELEEASEHLKTALDSLRTQLYAKFGNHISLEQ